MVRAMEPNTFQYYENSQTQKMVCQEGFSSSQKFGCGYLHSISGLTSIEMQIDCLYFVSSDVMSLGDALRLFEKYNLYSYFRLWKSGGLFPLYAPWKNADDKKVYEV